MGEVVGEVDAVGLGNTLGQSVNHMCERAIDRFSFVMWQRGIGQGTHGYYPPGKGIDAETRKDADPAVSSIWRRQWWCFCGGYDNINWLACIIVLLLGVIGDVRGSAIRHGVPVQSSSFLRASLENEEEEPFAPS